MNDEINNLTKYENVSEEVKYVSNSIMRLKILATLYEEPQNVRDLADSTKLSYSSISGIIHDLELKDFVYRESNKYHISNSLKVQIDDIMELKEVVNLLNKFFNILDGHVVDMIPNQSVAEIYLLGNANLLEADNMDAYKISNFIKSSLTDTDNVQCVLPFYHDGFNTKFNELVDSGRFVEALVSEDVFKKYEDISKIKYLSSFKGENSFLLIVSDEMMILGLFSVDGYFDQNRILTSKDTDSIEWARNLYKNFKNRNK